jgi:integrase/recombinase XerD
MKEKAKILYSFNHGKISGAVILDTRRGKAKDLFPIKYRITYLRKQVYYSSGYSATLNEWQRIPDSKSKDLIEKRNLIKSGFDLIEAHIKGLKDNYTFEALNNRLGKGATNDIFSMFNSKVERLKSEGKIGTAEWYYYSANSLLKYINDDKELNRKRKKTGKPLVYQKKTLKFSVVTPDWLKKYEKWLLECDKKYTSISMFMRGLQAIFNDAKDLGIIAENQYPFGEKKYERPEGEGRKMALTLEQINELMNVPLANKFEIRSRDLFYFSYLTNGINMNDIFRLKYSNIVDGEIYYYRIKTIKKKPKKTEIKAFITPKMIAIIEKWGNINTSADDYIFPFFNDVKTPIDEKRITKQLIKLINTHLKKIAGNIGINHISTYTARHSFATVLKRSGVNIAEISEALGHSDLKTTENYLASFGKETRIKNANLLT